MLRKCHVAGHITKFIGARHPEFISKSHPDFGKRTNPTLEDYIRQAVVGTFEATGIDGKLVEKAWIGNVSGSIFISWF